jgi:thymidylate synthase (FAD)
MGQIVIQEETTKNPLQLMGKEAGICYGTNIEDKEKNYKRGLDCLKSGHGRVSEYPQIYMIIDGYSARVIRELYTHIGGAPTRLQASTRYINYKDYEYIIPSSIEKNENAKKIYLEAIESNKSSLSALKDLGIPKEDIANLLPLGMTTKIVLRTNLRNLIDMSHQRLCTRAYWEYRQLMQDIMNALKDYSEEWKIVVEQEFKPKCEVFGYCSETKSCGRKPKPLCND